MNIHCPDRLLSAVVGAVFLFASSAAVQAQTTRLIHIEPVTGARQAVPGYSDRPHLNLSRPGRLRSRPELVRRLRETGPALPDTLHVLVLRLQFQTDELTLLGGGPPDYNDTSDGIDDTLWSEIEWRSLIP